ncbi:MAG: hypothetical protein WBJ81_02675, partial [Rickettsiales bacterium]
AEAAAAEGAAKGSSSDRKKSKMLNFRDEQGNLLNLTTNADGDMVDTSGNIWSMLVINTDTTQKTMPGNRVLSHRTLVMMGNLKGTGGFGMGKGKTPADSLTAACRYAFASIIMILFSRAMILIRFICSTFLCSDPAERRCAICFTSTCTITSAWRTTCTASTTPATCTSAPRPLHARW